MLAVGGVDQKGDVAVVHEATVHELHFAAEIFDDALFPQAGPVADLDQFFGGDGHQADGAAHTVQSAGLLQCSSDAQQGGRLGVVAAGVNIAGLRITLGMGGDDQAVQLAHDQQFGAGLAGVDIGIETGDIARLHQFITQLPVFSSQIFVGLPLTVTGFGMLPNMALGGEHQLTLGGHHFF